MTEEGLRLRLILGKYRVTKVKRDALEVEFTMAMGSGVNITVSVPPYADVNEGDILTLYTEVLTHANTQQPPIQ